MFDDLCKQNETYADRALMRVKIPTDAHTQHTAHARIVRNDKLFSNFLSQSRKKPRQCKALRKCTAFAFVLHSFPFIFGFDKIFHFCAKILPEINELRFKNSTNEVVHLHCAAERSGEFTKFMMRPHLHAPPGEEEIIL